MLCGLATIPTMRRNHLNGITFCQVPVQGVAVVCSVPDQAFREHVEEAVPENAFDQLAFMRRSAFHTNG